MAKEKLKTEYTDPTHAVDPPGGKHHSTDGDGSSLPTDRPLQNAAKISKKSVAAKKLAKAKR